jgi:Uma2 family endonuclease
MKLPAARIPLDRYERMVEAGVFEGEMQNRVELIEGTIVHRNPVTPRHANATSHLIRWSYGVSTRNLATVSIRSPVLLPETDSAPDADVAWIRRRKYDRLPRSNDVFLIVEVADETLELDCDVKARMYAASAIEDYWVVNLIDETIEVFREPSKLGYRRRTTFGVAEEVAPHSFPELSLRVNDVVDPDLD